MAEKRDDLELGIDPFVTFGIDVPVEQRKFYFSLDGWDTPFLVFQGDGKVYVRGELVDDNRAIYAAVVEFFERGRKLMGPTPDLGEIAREWLRDYPAEWKGDRHAALVELLCRVRG